MKNKGIIRIVAVPNPVLFGYRAWAKIGIKVAPESVRHVAHELIEHNSVYFVAYALGTFNIIIAVYFDNFDSLAHFVNSELARVKGILSTETMLYMHPRKYYNFSWPPPVFKKGNNAEKHDSDVVTSHNDYEIDEIDRRIINILKEDGLIRPAALKRRGIIKKYGNN
jgi:DNA-binding Lrp family transcriptional regulator